MQQQFLLSSKFGILPLRTNNLYLTDGRKTLRNIKRKKVNTCSHAMSADIYFKNMLCKISLKQIMSNKHNFA